MPKLPAAYGAVWLSHVHTYTADGIDEQMLGVKSMFGRCMLLTLLLLALPPHSVCMRCLWQGLAGQRMGPANPGDVAAGIHLHLQLLCTVSAERLQLQQAAAPHHDRRGADAEWQLDGALCCPDMLELAAHDTHGWCCGRPRRHNGVHTGAFR